MWYPPAFISDKRDWIEVTAWKVDMSEHDGEENNSSYLDCLDWNAIIQGCPIAPCSAHFTFTISKFMYKCRVKYLLVN